MSSPISIELAAGKKAYFLSDFHLENFGKGDTDEREKCIVDFISELEKDAGVFFFLGDVFHVRVEYKHWIPKGCLRIQSKWLELKDQGIPHYFFGGNHDIWTLDYFEKYLGMPCFKKYQEFLFNGKTKMLIGHGDGLGPKDFLFKFQKSVLTHPVVYRLARLLHPSVIYLLADTLVALRKHQTSSQTTQEPPTFDENKEWLIWFSKTYLKKHNPDIDYFIFGHRHVPCLHQIPPKSTYINTGAWTDEAYSYASFDGEKMDLHVQTSSSKTLYHS